MSLKKLTIITTSYSVRLFDSMPITEYTNHPAGLAPVTDSCRFLEVDRKGFGSAVRLTSATQRYTNTALSSSFITPKAAHNTKKNTQNTLIIHVEPKNITKRNNKWQATDRQIDELIYTHSRIILYTNRDVSSRHWFSNKTVPDTWWYQLLWCREGQNIVFCK